MAVTKKNTNKAKASRSKPNANKVTQKKENKHLPHEGYNTILLDRLKVALLIIIGALAIFLLLSLFSYNQQDPAWSSASSDILIHNAAGAVGAYSADVLLSLFGVFGYVIPFLLVYGLWVLFIERNNFYDRSIFLLLLRWIGVILNFLAGSGLSQLAFTNIAHELPQGAGGICGVFISNLLILYLNTAGTVLTLIAAFLLGLTLFSGALWFKAIAKFLSLIWNQVCKSSIHLYALWCESRAQAKIVRNEYKQQKKQDKLLNKNKFSIAEEYKETVTAKLKQEPDNRPLKQQLTKQIEPDLGFNEDIEHDEVNFAPFDDYIEMDNNNSNMQNELLIKQAKPTLTELMNKKEVKAEPLIAKQKVKKPTIVGGLPSLSLLDDPEEKSEAVSKDVLERMALLVEEKLADFGVKVSVAGVYPGPVITRFELELAPGVKVNKLTTLSQDLARALSTNRVRVVEVIPGKPYVGIELPNQKRETVRLKEVLASELFERSKSPLTITLGKDIAGMPQIADLAKMPHLLVAGTTGSGKSVGVNAMIISMLYKSGPEDLRLIMIDPKMLELSIYEGIPHLLTPVVTDMNEAANALRWCVKEMDNRYELMAAVGVRNIAGLNTKIKNAKGSCEPMKDPLWIKAHPGNEANAPELEKLPYIVVIADEFADMMMVVGKKVEELIARIAQKARAAGIHLILATQRPSVDVVTGLIKANIPTRIAFQVSSKIDSRTILDQQGAEQLLGNGDMLYLPPGTGLPIRVHGAFVDDDEVHRVVGAWQEMGEPNYIDSIISTETLDEEMALETSSNDALYDEAVQIILDTQRASISSIQRRLRIGYNRAARLIEEMEAAGVVSTMQTNGMREVLVRK